MPDHELLPKAESERFDVLITNDKDLIDQQNNAKRKIALVVLSTNSRKTIRSGYETILRAVEQSVAGSY